MVSRGVGTRVDRVYTDGGHARKSEVHDTRTSSPMPVLRRAVVTEVFFSPSRQLDEATIERLKSDVKNPEYVSRIGRNCILARTITGGSDNIDEKPSIFLPLFGPYVTMPVKPGEHVYIIHEDPSVGTDVGMWLCRIPEFRDTDDVNYTHADRRYEYGTTNPDTIDKLDGTVEDYVPGFSNGNPSIDSLTFGKAEDEYERVIGDSKAYKQFVPEAVPRFDSRPGDLTFQGSNNTLITMTTDRTGPAMNDAEVVSGAGTVMIVCGRGQSDATAPKTIKNAREYDEVNKVPHLKSETDNQAEGDIDFNSDASIFMVSMKTNVDENFDINIPFGGESSPGNTSAIALKSDQLRLVGRQDVKIQAGENGTGAAIVLKANGDILLIPGPAGVIMLGGTAATMTPLGNAGANTGGTIAGLPILSTMAGVLGTPGQDPHGFFSTKVLFK